MRELIKKKMPSSRGMYLFTWALVYYGIAALLFYSGTRELVFIPVIFTIAATISILASFWHQLDLVAFTALSGAAAFQGFFTLLNAPATNILIAWMLIWFGVALGHFIVVKWPNYSNRVSPSKGVPHFRK